jgi:hypothetical protein
MHAVLAPSKWAVEHSQAYVRIADALIDGLAEVGEVDQCWCETAARAVMCEEQWEQDRCGHEYA